MRTQRLTPPGLERSFRRRPSGSTQPAAGSMARSLPGETPCDHTVSSWLTSGREISRGETPARRAGAGRLRWGCFRQTRYDLYDVTGNVWEWTADYYAPGGAGSAMPASPCCGAIQNPRVQTPEKSYDAGNAGAGIPRRTIKGGSHLCAPSYCLRYRPAARQPEAVDTSTSHLGFRCVKRQTGETAAYGGSP